MSVIKVMDPHLANMIAAGEVVERPSSVIKELVENSLDAGSKNIIVKIYQSGRKKIIVSDDGCGMDKDDALLCFKRHASSKLYDEYQLFHIKTMGFRGEALPSIASVSKIAMETSQDGISGTKVFANEEDINSSVCACKKGTTFTVEELFYNTPARLKYLKSDYTETASCLEIMQKLALSRSDVAFSFYIDDKLSFKTTGRGDDLEVIASIYGVDAAKKMLKISYDSDSFSFEGYISKPELSRSNRYSMLTFINDRNVYLPLIQKAIIEGYGSYLFSNRYPICMIKFRIDSSLVDVNVHPSKKEVRLSNESEIINVIRETVKDTLTSLNPLQKANIDVISKKEAQYIPLSENLEELVKPAFNEPKATENTVFNEEKQPENSNNDIEVAVDYTSYDEDFPEEQVLTFNEKEKEEEPFTYKIIGQIHDTYIVMEVEDGFYLVDQHAANERINYEKFDAIMNSHLEIITPLTPIMISLSPSEIALFSEEKQNLLKQIGINAYVFGNNVIKVESYPLSFEEDSVDKYLEELITSVINEKHLSLSMLRQHVIATKACKASIKANDKLTMLEMETLIKNLFKCHNPTTCPHGRPTIIHFTNYDIEKLFKRSGI